MKKSIARLTLDRETLRRLEQRDLEPVAGGSKIVGSCGCSPNCPSYAVATCGTVYC